MPSDRDPVGVGLGFRAVLAEEMLFAPTTNAKFVEVAPENYLGVGGQRGRWLAMAAERWPVVSHGLCGDFSGSQPLDTALLTDVRGFLRSLGARWYSDHLCFTNLGGVESHDLLPLPFTDEAVERAAQRVREVRDVLEMPVAVENVSAYLRMPGGTLEEAEFVKRVVEAADCHMLLDINNVYVNSVNFGFDAKKYIDALPLDRVIQFHIAGHDVEEVDADGKPVLVVDTHGSAVIDPVYDLLDYTLRKMRFIGGNAPPVLLERDHDIPKLAVLEQELSRLQGIVDDVRRAR
jgi:uncharacterized protein (UPF0276 family)